MEWTQDMHDHLFQLKRQNMKWKDIVDAMDLKFDGHFTYDNCRNRYRNHRTKEKDEPKEFSESLEIKQDGSHRIESLIELSETEKKNPDDILRASGYDPDKWKVRNVKFSRWHHLNKKMSEPKTLYAIKLDIEPKQGEFDFDTLLETICDVPESDVKISKENSETYLNINLSDMHFGIMTYEDYEPTLERIISHVREGHKEILIILGNDLLHVNNFQNTTESGREIQQIDLVNAWQDARRFYYALFDEAIKNSKNVYTMYIRGNHSGSLEYAFIQMLKERFPQITVDDSTTERKAYMLGNNLVFATHGDKKKLKKLPENLAVESPSLWAKAKTRTAYVGHYHFEKVIDDGGIVLRQLPTGVNPDSWHQEMGYTDEFNSIRFWGYEDNSGVHETFDRYIATDISQRPWNQNINTY